MEPNDAEFYFNRGYTHSEAGDYYSAIKDYTTVIELYPDLALAYHNRDAAHSDLKDYHSAIEDYTKATDLDPDYTPACINRGDAYIATADYASAQADYVRYAFLGEIDYDTYYTLLTFFRDFADAPFVVKRLLGQNPVLFHLHSYRHFLERAEAQCRPVLDFLDSLEQHG